MGACEPSPSENSGGRLAWRMSVREKPGVMGELCATASLWDWWPARRTLGPRLEGPCVDSLGLIEEGEGEAA